MTLSKAISNISDTIWPEGRLDPMLRFSTPPHHLCQFQAGAIFQPLSFSGPQLLHYPLSFSPTPQLLPGPTASHYALRFSSASPLGLKRRGWSPPKDSTFTPQLPKPKPPWHQALPKQPPGSLLPPHASVKTLGSHSDHFPLFLSLQPLKCVSGSMLPEVFPAASGPPPRAPP